MQASLLNKLCEIFVCARAAEGRSFTWIEQNYFIW